MPQDPMTIVRTTERLWSEEVARADADSGLPTTPVVYEFNGGRRLFRDKEGNVYE